MQRKSIIVPIIALLTVGAVWAGSSLFPSPTGFPANPSSPGTLGYVLAFFGVDGKAPDSAALAGRSATGYLQGNNCTAPGEVWRGVDTSGKAVCGLRSTPLAIGRFCTQLSPEVRVLKNGNAPGVIVPMGELLQSGDIIQTGGGTATVCFDADDSILRLDTGTVVALEAGYIGSNTVAQAILSDGRLWGRVLTSTGINIGGGGLIAGVRGTSISVEKNIAAQYTLSLIDSQSLTTAATLTGSISIPGGIREYPAGKQFTYLPGVNSISPTTVPKSSILTLSIWARENMKKDIDYLMGLSPSSLITAERAIATPIGIAEQDAICITDANTDGGRWWSDTVKCQPKGIIAFADYTKLTADMTLGYAGVVSKRHIENTCYNRPFPSPYYNTSLLGAASCYLPISIECDPTQVQVTHTATCNPVVDGTKTYHPILKEDIPFGQNGRQADCVIMDEYGNPALLNQELDANMGGAKLDIWCANPGTQNIQNIGLVPTLTTNGVAITANGKYLKYDGLDLNMLKGKTVTVALANAIGTSAISGQVRWVIADLGTERYYMVKNGKCAATDSSGNYICKTTTTPSSTTVIYKAYNSETNLSITLATTPSQFIIGNASAGTPAYNQPIGSTIQKINIQ